MNQRAVTGALVTYLFFSLPCASVSNVIAADFPGLTNNSQTGESLLELIRKSERHNVSDDPMVTLASLANAVGYVQAVRDYNAYSRWNMVAVLKKQPLPDLEGAKPRVAALFSCEPTRMSNGQAIAITKRYLEQSPARWHESAFNLVSDALKSAYPCKVEDLFP